MDSKRLKPKRRNAADTITIDLPQEVADQINAITSAHPFSRSRLGLLAITLALPELQKRYPVTATTATNCP